MMMINRHSGGLMLATAMALLPAAASAPAKGKISAESYRDTVQYLASDQLRGRGTGSPQLEKAASFIAGQFKRLGIPPADGRQYYQRFRVTTNAKLGKGNALVYTINGGAKTALPLAKEFGPFNSSGSGKASGAVVFAGYGITAPEYSYDDYAGIDAKGKIVMVLRHEPQEFDAGSRFAGKGNTSHSEMTNKAVNAKYHGARAVLFINDVMNHPSDPDELEKFSPNVGPNSPDVPVIQVRAATADKWLAAAGAKSLKEWVGEVDADLKPRSFEIAKLAVEVSAEVKLSQKSVPNVAAYLKGESDEYVILGAHFDHLGMGERSSMAPDLAGKAIHHGADDNASGSAGLLELAAWFAGQPKQKRGILFLAFSGEELGLIGSGYYANHPILPLEKAAAMINMDMIGRIKEGRVFVGGSGTSAAFPAILDQAKAHYNKLKLDISDQGGYGSSDHFSFNSKEVPVLFFFSGLHSDYHKPSDTWDKIDQGSAAELLRLVAEVTTSLGTMAAKPVFIKVQPQLPQASASASPGGGAWFGSVPDMAESKIGFRLSDVTKGSPADEAGLKGGDLITEFDGKPISNLYDFTYVLRGKKPGDVVAIKYKRGAEELATKATLRARSQMR